MNRFEGRPVRDRTILRSFSDGWDESRRRREEEQEERASTKLDLLLAILLFPTVPAVLLLQGFALHKLGEWSGLLEIEMIPAALVLVAYRGFIAPGKLRDSDAKAVWESVLHATWGALFALGIGWLVLTFGGL